MTWKRGKDVGKRRKLHRTREKDYRFSKLHLILYRTYITENGKDKRPKKKKRKKDLRTKKRKKQGITRKTIWKNKMSKNQIK